MNRPTDGQPPRDVITFGRYRFDRTNRILSCEGRELPLPPRAAAVLSALVESPGAVVSKQALIERVWNGAYVGDTALSEAVRLVRQAFEDDPQESRYIQTLHRRGYRFIAPLDDDEPPPVEAGHEPKDDEAPEETPDARVSPDDLGSTETPAEKHRPLRWLALLALIALVAGAFVAGRRSAPAPSQRVSTRFSLTPGPGTVTETWLPSLAVSPDGRHLVYVVNREDHTVLFHRDISSFSGREIPGTRGAMLPFFSPDGRRVGYLTKGQLVAVPLSGGTPVPLVQVRGPFGGAAWGPDDTLIYAAGSPASLYRVRPDRPVEQLTRPDPTRGEFELRWPHVLPGGEEVLFTSWSTTVSDARVEWLSLTTGARRTVVNGAADPRFIGGFLVCVRPDRTIVAAAFDSKRGQLTGSLFPIVRDVHLLERAGVAQVAIGGGTLAYIPSIESTGARAFQRLVNGKPQRLPAPARFYQDFQLGPRNTIATTVFSRGRSDIWLVAEATGASSRITFDGFNRDPVWSPDGAWVAFASKTDGPYNIHRRRVDGGGPAERLIASSHDQFPVAWSPDGRELLLCEARVTNGADLSVLDLATRRVRPWLATKAREVTAAWSPDGKWLAYSSDESGSWEVYVRSYPEGRGLWQVTPDGGADASWSEDGRAIYFRRLDEADRRTAELWTVPISPTGGELNPGRPRRVYASAAMVFGSAGHGGVTLLLTAETKANANEIRVVRDWMAALAMKIAER